MELFEHFLQGAAFADVALEDLRVPDKPAGIKGMGLKSSLGSSPRALFSFNQLAVARSLRGAHILPMMLPRGDDAWQLIDRLDRRFDESQDFLSAVAGRGGGFEDDGFAGAEFLHRFGEEADVFFDDLGFDLVGFGEDEGEEIMVPDTNATDLSMISRHRTDVTR